MLIKTLKYAYIVALVDDADQMHVKMKTFPLKLRDTTKSEETSDNKFTIIKSIVSYMFTEIC